MGKIKVGIIGTGFIGPAHVEALRRLGNIEIAALADVDAQTAKKKAEILSIDTYYGDYRELLMDTYIQVVHICTPNYLHYPMAKEALYAGKHVVCEKPLAMCSKEAEELVKIAEENKLVNAVHFNLRFYPLIHHAKQMVENGEIGKILAINGCYQQDWLFHETDYNWRLQPEFSGDSRAVADIGSHWLDLVEFVSGMKVKEVCADFATFHPVRKKPIKAFETYSSKLLCKQDYQDINITTEDYASVLLRFDDSAHGSMTVNQVAAGRKNYLNFEIYGSKIAIGWNSEKPNELWIGKRDGKNEILLKDPSLVHQYAREIISYPGGHNEGFPDTSKQMFSKLYKYIEQRGHEKGLPPDFPTFRSGYRELLLCEDIVKSARENRWINTTSEN